MNPNQTPKPQSANVHGSLMYQQPPVPPQIAGQPHPPAAQSRPRKLPMRRRRGQRGCWLVSPGCILGCAGVMAAFAIVFVIGSYLIYYTTSRRIEDRVDELEAQLNTIGDPNVTSGFETTYIYDRTGENKLWEVFGQGRRRQINLEEMPDVIIHATISVEDDDFYSNPGFDVKSNIRAVWQLATEGEVVSGASTITQQLVRNVFFTPEYRAEVSYERKFDEILMAMVLTQRMSKDEILELYLNQIYYGNLAYGIEAASQTYFGKSALDLELHEAALLAGLPQEPGRLNPLNPDPFVQADVIERQHLVLDLMVKEGYITEAEAEQAKLAPLNYVSPDVPLVAPHFTLYARQELEDLLVSLGYSPEFINDGGLRVYTTIDLEFQEIAQRGAENTVHQLRDQHNLTNAAVVVLHPPSGEIMAMVGSIDYNDASIDGEVNVAVSPRQPGSTMKPFTYAATMEQGWTAGTILWDVRTDFGIQGSQNYVPDNYDSRFHGPVRVRDALANSYNIPAVKALRYLGVQYLLDYLRRLGVYSLNQDASNYGLSLTLGGGEITLLEMTNGYATFARSGLYVRPTSIRCVIDKNDNIIYQYEMGCPTNVGDIRTTDRTHNVGVQGTPAIDPRIAFIISDILADNAARTPAMGANSPLNTGSLLTSVKTGTTNDFKDNWTVGYTHDIAVGVWSGNSNGEPMIDVSGLAGAAPIWNEVMLGIYRSRAMPPSVLQAPPGISQRQICNIRGMTDPTTTCNYRTEWFLDSAPLVPDGQGGLMPLNLPAPQPPLVSEFGPRMREIEPGIWDAIVRPVDVNQANVLMSVNPNIRVEPRYCLVPAEVLDAVLDEQTLIFIAPPDVPSDQSSAYQYAANAGIPILPQAPCTLETINMFAPVAPGVVAQIVSPTNGQTVSGLIDIYGVVNYPDDRFFDYYKLEVRGPSFPDWTTFGAVHHNEVHEPAVLETLYGTGLAPGTYEIQLFIQGDLTVQPHIITINVVPPG